MADELPEGYKGAYLGEGVIVYSGKPSTRTRLHEIAHKRMGHEPGEMPVSEFVSKEIDAEIWAWEAMSKKPNYRVGVPAYVDLIDQFGIKPRRALGIVSSELRKRNIKIDRKGRDWYLERG